MMKREEEFKVINLILSFKNIWPDYEIKTYIKHHYRFLSDKESNIGGEPKFNSGYNLKNSKLLSEQAKKENNFEGGREKRTTTNDHPYPLNYLVDRAVKDGYVSRENWPKLLKMIKLIVITEEENKKLNKAGLRQKMPFEVDDVYNIKDEYARYKVVGIKVIERKVA